MHCRKNRFSTPFAKTKSGIANRKGIIPTVCKGDVRQLITSVKCSIADIRYAFGNRYAGQATAAGKSRIPDARHALRNRDTGQAAAAPKGRKFDARHALWNRDAGQTAAALKGPTFDARHTLRNPHTGQAAAAFKGRTFDTRHAIRNRNAAQAAAVVKGSKPDARHTLRNRDTGQAAAALKGPILNPRYAIRNRNAAQAATMGKGRLPDARHALRNRDAGQAAAALKGTTSDARHALRNRDAGQAVAAVKGTLSDARHTGRYHHVYNILPVFAPGGGVSAVVVLHFPRTGNRQCSVLGQHPCQIVPAGAGIDHIFRQHPGGFFYRLRLCLLCLRRFRLRLLCGLFFALRRNFRLLRQPLFRSLGGFLLRNIFLWFCLFHNLRGFRNFLRLFPSPIGPDRGHELEGHGQGQEHDKQFFHDGSFFPRFPLGEWQLFFFCGGIRQMYILILHHPIPKSN